MATTVNTLETDTEVFKGDRVVADGVERSLGDVTTAGLVSSIDPFGDGSLLAKYELDGDANDTRNIYNESAANVPFSTTAKFGTHSGSFSGNYIRLASLRTTLMQKTNRTVSVWINTTDTSTSNVIFADYDGASYNFILTHNAGKITAGNRYNNVSNTTQNQTIINDGNWHHIVATLNVSTLVLSLYIDNGTPTTTSVSSNAWVGSGYDPMIGTQADGANPNAGAYYSGLIDQVEIYNRVLTPTEVNTLFTQTSTKYTADFNTPLASIPTSVYRLDHDNLTIDGTPTDTTATVLDSRTGLIASGDTVLLDGVGVVCNPVVEGTVVSTVVNDEFETVLYDGNGGTKTVPMANITNGVDFVWIKDRDHTNNHSIFDSVRGISYRLNSNNTSIEVNDTDNVTAFNTTSFEVGSDTKSNTSGNDYVAWCASLPNHTPSNTAGTITSETKSNSFMSVVSYTGTGSNATVGHSLSVAPELILFKNRNAAEDWIVYNATITASKYLVLNTIAASNTHSGPFNNTAPTSNVFTVNTTAGVNGSTNNIIAYCFTSVAGKCKVGSYTGSVSDVQVITDFEPAWVMIKRTNSASDWVILDSTRDAVNPNTLSLRSNLSIAEVNTATVSTNFNSNGFTVVSGSGNVNASTGTYIYLAIAKDVDVTTPKYDLTYPTQTAPTRIALSNNDIVPTVASDVFDGTDTFTRTYNKVTKTARDVEYGFVADTDVEIIQLNINQNMEP